MARSRAGVADSHMTAGISPGGDLRFHSLPVLIDVFQNIHLLLKTSVEHLISQILI